MVARIKRAFDLVDLELLKDVNLFVGVLEQDAKDSKVDPAASALEVVTDVRFLQSRGLQASGWRRPGMGGCPF